MIALHTIIFLRFVDAGGTALREPEDPGVGSVVDGKELEEPTDAPLAATLPELVSRFRCFRSARISAALWQRTVAVFFQRFVDRPF